MCLWVKGKLSNMFCQIKYEAFATDPFISEVFALFYFVFLQLSSVHLFLFLFLLYCVIFYVKPHFCCLLCLIFSLYSCISYCCFCISWEFCCCVCLFVFFSHQFCCFTSVKSGADVRIIPYNALVISQVSLAHWPRCRHRIWPNYWLTYDIKFMNINR